MIWLANLISSVHYEIPKTTHTHKSMLLRGVKFAEPALNQSDIEVTKGRAARSGRSHGGVPLQGNGGPRNSFNYSSNQNGPPPNHRQSYPPQNGYSNYPVPPPGWQPPPPGLGGFGRGLPPPPPPNSYYGGRGGSGAQGGYSQPPRHNAPPGYGPPPPGSGGSNNQRRGGGDGYGYGSGRRY
jgi:5'-3' exoribonuclease 2